MFQYETKEILSIDEEKKMRLVRNSHQYLSHIPVG